MPNEDLLTRRELQLIDQVCLGNNIKCAASAMNISVHTARTHVHNIMSKLNVTNMPAVIARLSGYRPPLSSSTTRKP